MAERKRRVVDDWLRGQHLLFCAALSEDRLTQIIQHTYDGRVSRVPGAGADPAWKEFSIVGTPWQVQISLDQRSMRHRPLCEPWSRGGAWVHEDEPWIAGAPDEYFRALLLPPAVEARND
jgi:hypothetical protein